MLKLTAAPGTDTLARVDGEVASVDDGVIWLRTRDGKEVSLQFGGSSQVARAGHRASAVYELDQQGNRKCLRFANEATGDVFSDATLDSLHQAQAGKAWKWFMQPLVLVPVVLLLVPGINLIVAGIFLVGVVIAAFTPATRAMAVKTISLLALLLMLGLALLKTNLGVPLLLYAPTVAIAFFVSRFFGHIRASASAFVQQVDQLLPNQT
jgi:hypothetical protein